MLSEAADPSAPLTDEQRQIVEWGDGPLVVIAGAGTGKTRVIVERVRWLLETKGGATEAPGGGLLLPAGRTQGGEATETETPDPGETDDTGADRPDADQPAASPPAPAATTPFTDPLLPEQILVLTYNVKAARELRERIEKTVGPAVAARIAISNFHSFCHRILTEAGAEAGLPPTPEVLDGIGQVLLLRDIRPSLPLVYHSGRSNPTYWLDQFVAFISRAKDELVTPTDFDAYVDRERQAFEAKFGPIDPVFDRLRGMGVLDHVKWVQREYKKYRAQARAADRAAEAPVTVDPETWEDSAYLDPNAFAAVETEAEKAARRIVGGTGGLIPPRDLTTDQLDRIAQLAPTYVADGAALEVLRLSELALVYHAYEAELRRRTALDFGELIVAVNRLFKARPNILRRWQRQFRYLLVDEFQDANIAQIELIELLGRTPDRPDNVMVVGDDDQSIYRFRGASFAAFSEFDARFSRPPAHAREDGGEPAGTEPAGIDAAPGPPSRRKIEENFRSVGRVLIAANRLITNNELRFEPDKRLRATRDDGPPVELVTCAGPNDEAAAIVDRIAALTDWDPGAGERPAIPWRSFAVLYRKHRHREAIVDALRDAGIPYTVVGGLSLFETPEIRDLEQSLRAINDPNQAVAFVRMLTAGPWRLDSLEILDLTRMAARQQRALIEVIREVVESGEVEVEGVGSPTAENGGNEAGGAGEPGPTVPSPPSAQTALVTGDVEDDGRGGGLALQAQPRDLAAELAPTAIERPSIWDQPAAPEPEPAAEGSTKAAPTSMEPEREPDRHPRHSTPATRQPIAATTRAKLRRMLETLDELNALVWREGPLTILEQLLQKTGQVLDLITQDTLEAKRMVANIASLLRFAHDWQAEQPNGNLAGFVAYLDAYQASGGELPTAVEPIEDVDGVRLMTLYQAKGLEFPYVFVPYLLRDEWPARDWGSGLFPADLLRESIPGGDVHTEEERRLLYVAMTRARDGLMLTTHPGPTGDKEPSPFLAEIANGAGAELASVDRTAGRSGATDATTTAGTTTAAETTTTTPRDAETAATLRRVAPVESRRERRLTIRQRANELLNLLEGIEPDDPGAAEARKAFAADLADLAVAATTAADEARASGLDPLTMRVLATDAGRGANLLQVAGLPPAFSYTQLDTYERCPLQYAFRYVYRIPTSRVVAALTFGSVAHAAFEAFTRERREREARGESPPDRTDLERLFTAQWSPEGFPDQVSEDTYRSRVRTLLDNFWDGEIARPAQVAAEEQPFELSLDPGDGSPPVRIGGEIDRIDRLASGGIEIIDYKTGRLSSQKGVDESLQLSIYALASRDALEFGVPDKVTLYFTEAGQRMSTTRSDEQLDAARADILARAARIRAGDFAATPAKDTCWRCDFAPLCPSRVR